MKNADQVHFTNETTIWQVGMVNGSGYEFRADFFFRFNNRYFVVDAMGLKLFTTLDIPIFYN